MNKFIDLGHMESAPVNLPDATYQQPSYFMAHQAVIKPDSTTTKLRVVFDASAKRSTGLSLNDVLKVGATCNLNCLRSFRDFVCTTTRLQQISPKCTVKFWKPKNNITFSKFYGAPILQMTSKPTF
jgi:hypothetical protein